MVAVTAITLAVLGSLSHTSEHDATVASRSPLSGASPSRSAHRARPRLAAPAAMRIANPLTNPADASLRRTLGRQLSIGGAQTGALVYDLSAGQELYGLHDRVRRTPASVEKLWTTVALLRDFGPSIRLHTDVLGTGTLSGGVWHGNLYLRGGGDPTFGDSGFNQVWNQGAGPNAAQLVAQLRRRGIHRVTGRIYADESMFDRRRGGLMTDYAPDTPDFGGELSALTYDHGSDTTHLSPAQFAVKQMALTMRQSGITVRWSEPTASTPRRARLLAAVASPPLSVMTRLMDVPSDDLFAELLTKQLGVQFGHGGTISAGAQVIARTIAGAYDLHPGILDGSGLSRNDRSSPLEVVDLLREVWHSAVGGELAASLPTVGLEGTVASIGVHTAAQGRCIAKTGSLDNVTNLAGYCHSRGGHMLAFALFVDGPPNWLAFTLEGKLAAAIARY